jgi:hypothetical protein
MRAIMVSSPPPRPITPCGLSLPLQPGPGWRALVSYQGLVDMKADACDAVCSMDTKFPAELLYNCIIEARSGCA